MASGFTSRYKKHSIPANDSVLYSHVGLCSTDDQSVLVSQSCTADSAADGIKQLYQTDLKIKFLDLTIVCRIFFSVSSGTSHNCNSILKASLPWAGSGTQKLTVNHEI